MTKTKAQRQRYNALPDSLILNVIKGDIKTKTFTSLLTDLNVANSLELSFIHFAKKR